MTMEIYWDQVYVWTVFWMPANIIYSSMLVTAASIPYKNLASVTLHKLFKEQTVLLCIWFILAVEIANHTTPSRVSEEHDGNSTTQI